MCGIFGLINNPETPYIMIEALKKLEYRGYDSAGMVTLENGKFSRLRAVGKIVELENKQNKTPIIGNIGIAHTRWATHGIANENNAHPHIVGKVAIVHNGIIENYLELKKELTKNNYNFVTQTDSEIIAAQIDFFINQGENEIIAARESLKKFRGNYAIAILFEGKSDFIIIAKNNSSLSIGLGKKENFISSDINSLANHTDQVIDLEDGDIAIIKKDEILILDKYNSEKSPNIINIERKISEDELKDFPNYMIKEIYEQPKVIRKILDKYFDSQERKFINLPKINFRSIEFIDLIGCGSSFYAANIAKYWLEELANMKVNIDIASEYRYRNINQASPENLAIFISQSGETADTLDALKYAKSLGYKTLSLINVERSIMARISDNFILTEAGPEIGVASTKAFISQLTCLLILALEIGLMKGKINSEKIDIIMKEFLLIADLIEGIFTQQDQFEMIGEKIKNLNNIIYIGRNYSYPVACEAALKLKELSYIHAEAFAAGELKHGPIALIDSEIYVIVIALNDKLFEKIFSNIQEIKARGGKIIAISNISKIGQLKEFCCELIILPEISSLFNPLITIIPLQFIAYYTALLKKLDVDKPRNLAKSVTVE